MSTVGRVIGTEDATPLEFWVALAPGQHVQLDDVLAVDRDLGGSGKHDVVDRMGPVQAGVSILGGTEVEGEGYAGVGQPRQAAQGQAFRLGDITDGGNRTHASCECAGGSVRNGQVPRGGDDVGMEVFAEAVEEIQSCQVDRHLGWNGDREAEGVVRISIGQLSLVVLDLDVGGGIVPARQKDVACSDSESEVVR